MFHQQDEMVSSYLFSFREASCPLFWISEFCLHSYLTPLKCQQNLGDTAVWKHKLVVFSFGVIVWNFALGCSSTIILSGNERPNDSYISSKVTNASTAFSNASSIVLPSVTNLENPRTLQHKSLLADIPGPQSLYSTLCIPPMVSRLFLQRLSATNTGKSSF